MADTKKILVVEDDTLHIAAYSAKLTKAGFDFRIAEDGQEAFKILNEFTPDLILLDIIMPRQDGFAFLKQIKSTENIKHIPVIVASNLGQKEDVERGMQLGAEKYLLKTEHSLDDIVNEMLLVINRKGKTLDNRKGSRG